MPLTLYSCFMSPPCKAVIMTLKQLNIDFEIKETDISVGATRTPEFIKLNPAHVVPTLDDNGFILWESRAIMQYLCTKYAPDNSLYPKDAKQRALVDRWLNFDITLFSALSQCLITKLIFGKDASEEVQQKMKDTVKLLDTLIGDNKYLVGNQLTIADLSVLATTHGEMLFKEDLTDYPNLVRWSANLVPELPYFDSVNKPSKEDMDAFLERTRTMITAMMNK